MLSCLPLDPYFILQSGATSGIGKVTLNIQLGTHQGSLSSAACTVDFDDGSFSQSCNPPSHSYDEPGTYVIHANVTGSCGGTIMRTLSVEVLPDASASPGSSVSSTSSLIDDQWSASDGKTGASDHWSSLSRSGPEGLPIGPEVLRAEWHARVGG